MTDVIENEVADVVLSHETYAMQLGLLNKKLEAQKKAVSRAAASMFTGKGSKEDFDQARSDLQAIEYQIEGLVLAFEEGREIERRQKASTIRSRWEEHEPKLREILAQRLVHADEMTKSLVEVARSYGAMQSLLIQARNLLMEQRKFRTGKVYAGKQDERDIDHSILHAFREITGLPNATYTCAQLLTQAGLPVYKISGYRATTGDSFGNEPNIRGGAANVNDDIELAARLVAEFADGAVR